MVSPRRIALAALAVTMCGLAVLAWTQDSGPSLRSTLSEADRLVQGLDTGHNNVHNTASQIAELRAQVEADYQAVISQGKSAGYLPPVNLKQAEAQSLKAESFDEPNARAQSLASADWIKSFKSAQKSSSVMLGLKQPAKPKMMTKEQEVKQAEFEQHIIEKRAKQAAKHTHVGLAKRKPALGETKQAYRREKRMAAAEFAEDVSTSDKSFFTQSQHERVEESEEKKERQRDERFQEDEHRLRSKHDSYDQTYHQALKLERAKEVEEQQRLKKMKQDALEHHTHTNKPLMPQQAAEKSEAVSMQQKALKSESTHMDAEMDAILGFGPQKTRRSESSTKAAVMREQEHMADQIAAIDGTDHKHAQVQKPATPPAKLTHAEAVSNLDAIDKKLRKAHLKYQKELMKNLAKTSDPNSTAEDAKAAEVATQKFASFIKKIKQEQAHSEALKRQLLHTQQPLLHLTPAQHAADAARLTKHLTGITNTEAKAEVAETLHHNAATSSASRLDTAQSKRQHVTKGSASDEEREREYQTWKQGLPKAHDDAQSATAGKQEGGANDRHVAEMEAVQRLLHQKAVAQEKEERIVAAREEAANSAEAAAQQAISTVAAAHGQLNAAAGQQPEVGETGAEEKGAWSVVQAAIEKAKEAKRRTESMGHVSGKIAEHTDTKEQATLKRKKMLLHHITHPARTKEVQTVKTAAYWKHVEAEAKQHLALLDKKKKMAFMRRLADSDTFHE